MRCFSVCVLVLVAASCSGGDEDMKGVDAGATGGLNEEPCPYLRPLAAGTAGTFAWTTTDDDSETSSFLVGATVMYEGRSAVPIEFDWSHQDPFITYVSRQPDCKEHVHTGREIDSWTLSLDGAPSENKSFEDSDGLWTYTWNRHTGSVTVPAGTFDDCFDLTGRRTEDNALVSSDAYCRGIGLTKGESFYETYQATTVLTSYAW